MNARLGELTQLLQQCVVRIVQEGPDHIGTGTGFWIAPGIVLTCAHVVAARPDVAVSVLWGGGRWPGDVVAARPAQWLEEGSLWPYPDLALVSVPAAPAHPCVWVCEDHYEPDTRATVIGYSRGFDGHTREREITGVISGRHAFHDGWNWQLTGNQIDEGMSGSPVLNHRSGSVCGVLTSTRELDSDRGGFLVPISGMRRFPRDLRAAVMHAHDHHHLVDDRWTSLRAGLVPGPAGVPAVLHPLQEVQLLGCLARMPSPLNAAELYPRFARSRRPPAADIELLRDCCYALLDEPNAPGGELSGVLRFTDAMANHAHEPDVRERLRDWTTATAAKWDEDVALARWRENQGPAGRRAGQVVIVEIEATALDADRFRTTIWVHYGGGQVTQVYCDVSEARPMGETEQVVCAQLRHILGLLPDAVRVEFVTTTDLFDQPFENWVPTRRYTNLGRKFPVVLRDLDRIRDATTVGERRRDISTLQDWRRRWRRLRADAAAQPHWLSCDDAPDDSTMSAFLEQHAELAVLGSARGPDHPPVRRALEVALDHGVPAVVWRRRCPEHDAGRPEQPCTGERFRRTFSAVAGTSSLTRLPQVVREQRRATPNDHDHDCSDVALLWDDPDRLPQPFVPLRMGAGATEHEERPT